MVCRECGFTGQRLYSLAFEPHHTFFLPRPLPPDLRRLITSTGCPTTLRVRLIRSRMAATLSNFSTWRVAYISVSRSPKCQQPTVFEPTFVWRFLNQLTYVGRHHHCLETPFACARRCSCPLRKLQREHRAPSANYPRLIRGSN